MSRSRWTSRSRPLPPTVPGSGLLRAGRKHLDAADPKTAAVWFQRHADAHPNRTEGLLGLARCAEAMDDAERAVVLWARLVEVGGADAPPYWRTRHLRSLLAAGRTEEFHTELAAGRAGDPALTLYDKVTANTPIPPAVPPRFRHVVIVTYGRSGSTLLQGVLNTIDGVLIRGENDNLFVDLYRLARRIHDVRQKGRDPFTPESPWFGVAEMSDTVVLEALRPAARRLLLGDQANNPGVVTLGFKEIRFAELGDEFEQFLEFLSALLPDTAFLMNTRDLDRTIQSGWWTGLPASETRSRLERFERQMLAFADGRDDCFHIRYEDVVSHGPRLHELFDFLGAPYDPERVRTALDVRHSYEHASSAKARHDGRQRGVRAESAKRRFGLLIGSVPRRFAKLSRRLSARIAQRIRGTISRVRAIGRLPAAQALRRIHAAQGRGDLRSALDIAERALRRNQSDPALAMMAARLLAQWARWDEAASVLDRLPDRARDRVDVRLERAAVERSRDEHSLAIEHLDRALLRHPNDLELLRARFATLVDAGRFDDAEETLDRLVTDHSAFDTHDEELLLLEGRFQLPQVWEHAEARARERPDDLDARIRSARERFRLSRFGQPSLPDWDEGAQAELQALITLAPRHPGVLRLALRASIAADDLDETRRVLGLIPPDISHRFVIEARAWVAARIGRPAEEVRHIWSAVEEHHPLPQLRRPSTGELVPVGGRLHPSEPGAITLFTVVRNEAPRLQWFLEYYRRLGVDRFVFVDNASDDATEEILRVEPDVSIVHTDASYARARSGIVWLNHLMAELGSEGWNVYVDVDEALVFPGSEELTLKHLTAYLDRHGHEVVAGQMVDMFSAAPKGSRPAPRSESDIWTDPIEEHPWFNNSYRRMPKPQCPYVSVFGGARTGLGLMPEQTKTPLIRGGRNIRLLSSSHSITPATVSDVTCALLHFKLAGDYRATFERDVQRNHRRPHCHRRHLAYLAALDDRGNNKPDLTESSTVRYRSSQTLVDRGIMTAPPGFPPGPGA